MSNKSWMLTIPGALLLCASPALAVDLREAVQSALTTNPEIRQAVSNRAATEEERSRAGPLLSAHLGRRLGRRSQTCATRRGAASASPITRLWPVEGDLIVDQLVYRQRRPRGRNPPPGRSHRRRRGARRGALRICRAQRRAHLHRLSAAAAAGRDRSGQCDLPRAARRRPSRRRFQGLDQHCRPAAGRRAAAGRPRTR